MIVSTSIAKQGSSTYGNIAATVVLQVDPSVPYAPDPGNPGYGTIATVIADGATLFSSPQRTPTPALAAAHGTTGSTAGAAAPAVRSAARATPAAPQPASPAALAAGTHQFFFYTLEMHLMAESELTTAAQPAVLNEYVWFNDRPVAQIDATGVTSWTFTDHLGTPLLQTSAPQGIVWRAEYEPYGSVFALRSFDRHQPLRLPGQEAEQLPLGANGLTNRSYNIHRWYESGIARYSQPDPITERAALQAYSYVSNGPIQSVDPEGLCRVDLMYKHVEKLWHHAYVVTTEPDNSAVWYFRGGTSYDEGIYRFLGTGTGWKGGGYINTEWGRYGQNTIDYPDPGHGDTHRSTFTLFDNGDCCGSLNRCLRKALDAISRAHISYAFWGPNSNSVAHSILTRCGIPTPQKSPLSAPGWEKYIP